ncbi:hypothetical protein PG991_006564 [Apiospora marii]|uniref:Uncharacterized protein n=1 Tax=Apiospora marii TaxID=335849 RepID=A0ABR1RZH8_9PEZI
MSARSSEMPRIYPGPQAEVHGRRPKVAPERNQGVGESSRCQVGTVRAAGETATLNAMTQQATETTL